MSEGIVTEQNHITLLASAMKEAFPDALLMPEQARRGRYRLTVVSDSFNDMGHPERQRLVWDIADRTLGKADLRKVAMILTVAPSEIYWDPETE
jgi:stress-induced morphogen